MSAEKNEEEINRRRELSKLNMIALLKHAYSIINLGLLCGGGTSNQIEVSDDGYKRTTDLALTQ